MIIEKIKTRKIWLHQKKDSAAFGKREYVIPFAVLSIDYEAYVDETFYCQMLHHEICEISIEESTLNMITLRFSKLDYWDPKESNLIIVMSRCATAGS